MNARDKALYQEARRQAGRTCPRTMQPPTDHRFVIKPKTGAFTLMECSVPGCGKRIAISDQAAGVLDVR